MNANTELHNACFAEHLQDETTEIVSLVFSDEIRRKPVGKFAKSLRERPKGRFWFCPQRFVSTQLFKWVYCAYGR